MPEDSIRRVWTAIALYTMPGLGIGYHDISDADRAEIVALHPRPGFKRNILQAFTEGIAPRPE